MKRLAIAPAVFGAIFSLAVIGAAAQPPAPAQQGGAMQGFQMNRDQPVKIESDSLEVRDKSQQATFIGSVKLVQGETTIQCQTLVVFYEDPSAQPAPAATAAKKGAPANQKSAAAAPAPSSSGQQIKRVEAKGDVLVTQKDQTARGDNGIFDVKTNIVTLSGNVAVTQGTNVLRGDRMIVNLNTGVTHVESGQSKTGERQRVEGLFNPSKEKENKPASPPSGPAPATPAPPPAAKAGAPTRIN